MPLKQFGTTPGGDTVWLAELHAGSLAVDVITYGATIHRILAPGLDGTIADVILGKDDMQGYASFAAPAASVIGRVANRISEGSFSLNGKTYILETGEQKFMLHSGPGNYARKNYSVIEATDRLVRLAARDHGEAGFPGEIAVEVCYSLCDDGTLHINYTAIPTADTPINLTNHIYFNLAGQDSGTIYNQSLMIEADHYTPTSSLNIPTGEIFKTHGTPFDFTASRNLGTAIEGLKQIGDPHNGFDLNYVLNGCGWRKIAEAYDEGSGRALEAFTDLPGVQLYTANFIKEGTEGKGGAAYKAHVGFCLETQYFPDSIHQPHFPGGIAFTNKVYSTSTAYRFFTK